MINVGPWSSLLPSPLFVVLLSLVRWPLMVKLLIHSLHASLMSAIASGLWPRSSLKCHNLGLTLVHRPRSLVWKCQRWLPACGSSGTPCYVDSEGVVRMLNRSLGHTWTPVCNTRETCKSKSDHYWVVGVHENPQQLRWAHVSSPQHCFCLPAGWSVKCQRLLVFHVEVNHFPPAGSSLCFESCFPPLHPGYFTVYRCIPCKGSRYPPTLPRPAVAILPFKLPLCQTTTEKGQMEVRWIVRPVCGGCTVASWFEVQSFQSFVGPLGTVLAFSPLPQPLQLLVLQWLRDRRGCSESISERAAGAAHEDVCSE